MPDTFQSHPGFFVGVGGSAPGLLKLRPFSHQLGNLAVACGQLVLALGTWQVCSLSTHVPSAAAAHGEVLLLPR